MASLLKGMNIGIIKKKDVSGITGSDKRFLYEHKSYQSKTDKTRDHGHMDKFIS